MKLIRYAIVSLLVLCASVVGQSPATQSPTSYDRLKVGQNIMAHGARRDTTVNAATAFVSAMANLPDSGGTVIVPEGTFKLNTKLSVTKPHTIIKAEGAGAIIYMDSSLNAACSVLADYVTIEGITWRTNDTGSSAYFGFIHDSGNVGTTIRNNTFIGGGRQVRVVDADQFTYEGNYHTGSTDHRSPFSAWNMRNFSITDNVVKDITFDTLEAGGSNPRGFYIQNSSNGTISGNRVSHCDFSAVDGGSGISIGYYSHGITLTNNVCCSLINADGITVEEGAHSLTISNNICSWNDYSVGVDADSITGNGDGLDIFNGRDIMLLGNVCNHNGRGSNNGHPGIEIWGCSDIYAYGNICDSNGQNGWQIVQSSRVTVNGGSAKYNGRNGINIAGYAITVNTSGTSVTRTSGVSMGLGWKRGDTLSINSVKYLIAAVTGDNTVTLQSSAGTQTGVTAIYRPYSYRIENMDITDNNKLDVAGLQFHNGIFIDASTGWLEKNTITNTEASGSRSQKYGVTIAGGSVQYYGNKIFNNDSANFNDLVGASVGIIDTVSFLSIFRSGKSGYVYGDTLGDTNTQGFSIGTSSNSVGSGQPLWFYGTVGSTKRNIFAIHPMMYDGTGRAKGRLSFLGKANTSDTVMRQSAMIADDLRWYFGRDSATWYGMPLARGTTGQIPKLNSSGILVFSNDSVGTGGSGVTPGADTTLAAGGTKTAASGITRALAPLKIGFTANGDTILAWIDTTRFHLTDSLVADLAVKSPTIYGDAFRPYLGTTFYAETFDSVLFYNLMSSTSFLTFKERSPDTTEVGLGDNTVLLLPPGLWEFDSIAITDGIVDTGASKEHAYNPFPRSVPVGDSLITVIVKVAGNYDTAFFMPFSAFGGGGTDSAFVYDVVSDTAAQLRNEMGDSARDAAGDSVATFLFSFDETAVGGGFASVIPLRRKIVFQQKSQNMVDLTLDTSGRATQGTDTVDFTLTGNITGSQILNGSLLPGDADSTGQQWKFDTLYVAKIAMSAFFQTTRSDSTMRLHADEFFITNEGVADTMFNLEDSSGHTVIKPGDNTDFIATTAIFKIAGGTADSALATVGAVKALIGDSTADIESGNIVDGTIDPVLDMNWAAVDGSGNYKHPVAIGFPSPYFSDSAVLAANYPTWKAIWNYQNGAATAKGTNDTLWIYIDSSTSGSGDIYRFNIASLPIPENCTADSLVYMFRASSANTEIESLFVYADTAYAGSEFAQGTAIYSTGTSPVGSTSATVVRVPLTAGLLSLYAGRQIRIWIKRTVGAATSANSPIRFGGFFIKGHRR